MLRKWIGVLGTTLTLLAPAATARAIVPDLCLDSDALIAASFTSGGPAPAGETRTVSNCGGFLSLLPFAVHSVPNVTWLKAAPATGDLEYGEEQDVTITFHPEGLAPGLYLTTLRFQNVFLPDDYEDVPVLLQVDVPPADLTASKTLIDTLKSEVPIWKHQRFGDGTEEWVGAP